MKNAAEHRVRELEREREELEGQLEGTQEERSVWEARSFEAIGRAESAEALLANARTALEEMRLHDDTGDPRDVGYMAAVNEFAAVLAEITTASKEPRAGDDQALREAAHILRRVALDRDPRNALSSVPVEARVEAESWLAQWEPAASKETT
jgi:hypothetical protein